VAVSSPAITVVIPTYRDTDALARTLRATDFGASDVIVAATAEEEGALAPLRAEFPHIVWITAERGRARQMNAGAASARGAWLVFLHADTRLPPRWQDDVAAADAQPHVVAGCFRFALDSTRWPARVIEAGVALRVRLFALPYGDQAVFVRRETFERLGGYRDLPIMEDVDLVRRVTRAGALLRSDKAAVTSARRWERDGWVRRTARHVRLILAYFAGVPPERLIRLDPSRGAETSAATAASNQSTPPSEAAGRPGLGRR
jgi:rSAM/selenodomain-associated transferase 2